MQSHVKIPELVQNSPKVTSFCRMKYLIQSSSINLEGIKKIRSPKNLALMPLSKLFTLLDFAWLFLIL